MLEPLLPSDVAETTKIAYDLAILKTEDARAELDFLLGCRWSFAMVGRITKGGPIDAVMTGVILSNDEFEQFLRSEFIFVHHFLPTLEHLPRRTWDQLATMNSEGLKLLIGHFAWSESLSKIDANTLKALLIGSFAEHFAGLHVTDILCEVYGEQYRDLAQTSGFEEVIKPGIIRREHMMHLGLSAVETRQNTQIIRLFDYKPPRCRFSEGEAEILHMAHTGMPNSEIMRKTGLRKTALDSTWQRIFGKYSAVVNLTQNSNRQREVLDHIRAHPSELWPYQPIDA